MAQVVPPPTCLFFFLHLQSSHPVLPISVTCFLSITVLLSCHAPIIYSLPAILSSKPVSLSVIPHCVTQLSRYLPFTLLYTSYTSPTHILSFCYLLVYHPLLGVHLLCTVTSFNPPCTFHLFPDAPHHSFFRTQTIYSTIYHQSLRPPYTCHSSS